MANSNFSGGSHGGGGQNGMTGEEMLSKEQVSRILGVSIRSIDRYVHQGVLPRPKRLGVRLVRWTREDIAIAVAKFSR